MIFVRRPTRPSFIDKAGCTRQFESKLSLRSLAQLFPIKEGSTSHLGLLPSGEKRKPLLLVALNRFAIWLVGHLRYRQSVCAGWDRLGWAVCNSLFLYRSTLISDGVLQSCTPSICNTIPFINVISLLTLQLIQRNPQHF